MQKVLIFDRCYVLLVEETWTNFPTPLNLSCSICPSHRPPVEVDDIFRASLNQGIVRDQWKEAAVCPVYKGAKAGSRLSANSYRPVSLTSQCGKVLERIIKRELVFFEY